VIARLDNRGEWNTILGGATILKYHLPRREWSAPSAIGTAGFGFGGQGGTEITDFLIVVSIVFTNYSSHWFWDIYLVLNLLLGLSQIRYGIWYQGRCSDMGGGWLFSDSTRYTNTGLVLFFSSHQTPQCPWTSLSMLSVRSKRYVQLTRQSPAPLGKSLFIGASRTLVLVCPIQILCSFVSWCLGRCLIETWGSDLCSCVGSALENVFDFREL